MQKTPYMLVVGQRELENQAVSVRRHGEGDLGTRSIVEFIDDIKGEVKKTLDSAGLS